MTLRNSWYDIESTFRILRLDWIGLDGSITDTSQTTGNPKIQLS
jgi:hypothetical protein